MQNPAANEKATESRRADFASPSPPSDGGEGRGEVVSPPSADYFSRVIPDPYRILGLQLLPLSLGRYRLLKRFNVAFVSDDESSAEIGDLLLGVLICSMPCAEFLELANSRNFHREVARWSRRILPNVWIGALPFFGKRWRAKHAFNVLEKIALFQRYIAEGSLVPKYWDESPGNNPSGAHWSHTIEVALRSELGWTAAEIEEAPLTKAIADYFKFMESQGHVRLMTEDEESVPELTEEQLAAFARLAEFSNS